MTEQFVNRKGILIPASARPQIEQAAINAHREKNGIEQPTPVQQQAALIKMRQAMAIAIEAAAKDGEPIFGSREQGAGSLQAALVTAVDVGVEGLMKAFGAEAAVGVLNTIFAKIQASVTAAQAAATKVKLPNGG
jgi:hypothetical protein